MKRFCLYFLYICVSSIIISGCSSSHGNITGNDRDEHGCIGSAGYQWSELRGDCIRPFEEGVKLIPVEASSVTIGAYLVFNQDSSKAEAFTADFENNPILERTAGEELWRQEDGDSAIAVRREDGRWLLEIDGAVKYREERAD